MTAAYYNEINPYAAGWLRKLITAGLIPGGDVDTRDIRDVTANDIRGYGQCHFFAGIGGWPLALRMAGWPDERPIWTGSCPCQPFSQAGAAAGLLIPAICGPIGPGSSASAALSRSLASRLKARLAGRGSMLYRLTWKDWATPAGRPLCALRASVLRTSGTAYSGWPTPKAEDAESTGFSAKRLAAGKIPDNLHSATKLLLAGWATPAERDYRTPNHRTFRERGGGRKGEQLNNQVAHLIPGASLNGLTAPTDGGGLLNPAFSRWLQGFPGTWQSCAPTATRSTPTSRRKS